MKRVAGVLLVCILALPLVACGNEKGAGKMESKGYLPARIENIESGGSIPEGSEPKSDLEGSNYDISSFWGDWVLKGSGSSEIHVTDNTFNYDVMDDSGEKITLTVERFPKSFSFHPANIGNRMQLWNLESKEQSKRIPMLVGIQSSESEIESVPIEEAVENLGYGVGSVTLQGTEDYVDDLNLSMSLYGERAATYTVSGNTLAIGLLDVSCFTGMVTESSTESNIFEMDYEISWSGYELSLTYQGETAVYVPQSVEDENKILLSEAGLVEESSPMDGIYGISVDTVSSIFQIMKDYHEGYVDANISFDEDMVNIDGKNYPCAYSGESLTLFAEDGSHSTYSNYCFALAAGNAWISSNFYIGEQECRGWDTVGWFAECGFTTDLDLNQVVNPYAVTDDIVLDYDNSHITVKVNNPYTVGVPLRDCYVCSILIDDSAGIASKGDCIIGETSYEDIEMLYEAPYEKTPEMLRYKTSYEGGIVLPDFSIDNPYGTKQLDPGDYEVIYEFEDSILRSVRIERPSLLYNGLQDNMSEDALAELDPAVMTGIIEVRDNVLADLQQAFENAGISVAINEATGEIVMDTNVLFGYDSAELSEEGKAYIDNFMGVYASVILEDSLKDIISEVRFEGHTDSNGTYDYNLDLSQKRADAVLDYCLNSDASGMSPEHKGRLQKIASTIGYSFANLVYDSNGQEDADASRRVAIKFYIDQVGE